MLPPLCLIRVSHDVLVHLQAWVATTTTTTTTLAAAEPPTTTTTTTAETLATTTTTTTTRDEPRATRPVAAALLQLWQDASIVKVPQINFPSASVSSCARPQQQF